MKNLWGQVRLFWLLWGGMTFALGNKCPPPETIMPCRCRGRNEQVQVWCSHSDLERVNGALENLMRLRNMPAIDELIVENNKMPTLPARAFGALQIGRLLLRNNGLESLSRNAFAGLEDSLEEIYMVEERLVDFPFDAIEKLRNLEAFTMEKSKMRLLPKFNGLNRLKHIRIDGSSISALPVGAFAAMSSIKQIHMTNSKVDRLAEGIFGRLDSLLLANFTGNKIQHIQRRCFGLLPRLEVLSLGSNALSEATAVGRSMEELGALKSLDLSNNHFTELPEGSFVNLRSLQLLNLGGNQISRVHTRSFANLPALRKVDLNSNLLRNFPKLLFDTTPLLEELRMRKNLLGSASEIGEVLRSLKSLRYLDLGENGFKDFPTGAIRDHNQLQTLDLSDNRIRRVERNSFMSLPSLQELSLKNNSLEVVDNEAWDLAALKELDLSHNSMAELSTHTLQGLKELARVDFSHNSIKTIPQGVFSHTPQLEFLDFSGNQVSSLDSNALVGLAKLQKLDMSRNNIESLQDGSFRDLRALVSLSLAHNRMNNLPMNLLQDLRSLEELNLRDNVISYIPIGFFQSLIQLKELNLKHNSMAEIHSRLFAGLDNLEQLRLSSNQIRHFDDGAFDNFQRLRGIDLSSNRISRLPSNSFKNLPALEKFEARENLISVVDVGMLANTEGLQILDLAHNALSSVPQVIKTNPALKVIDLSHNQIEKMEHDLFTRLASLMELYMNDNKIKSLPPETFKNLNSLTIVDLDGNEVEEVVTGTFTNLPRLIYLRMSRNRVKRVARGGFSNLSSLDGLDMQENELEEISPGGFEKTGALKYLNLSHNNLDSMSRMGIHSLGSLEVLDISYNKLSHVDTDALRHLIWLVELRMNDNGLCMIPPGTFDGMSRLKMLVLRNNRLKHLYESVFYKLRNNISFMDVSGNPLECDCEMTWLRNLMVREELQELSDSTCEGPDGLKGVAVKEARPGRMICTGGPGSSKRVSSNFLTGDTSTTPTEGECTPLALSKRKPRPANVEPQDRPLFGSNAPEDFYMSDSRHTMHDNRRKDEKLIESNDYVAGDSPTIYAGTSNKGTQQEQKKSNGGVLSSIFGIPIDFGFNFGISPAFSWSDKNKGKKSNKKDSSLNPTTSHPNPLPPSWIQRPSKVAGNVYEAPEYLPRKPSQPYIPLNEAFSPPIVEPSGSVDVHKTVLPHKTSTGIKFPSEGTTTTPKWNSNYNHQPPNTETGFIPIEPFFHNHNQPQQPKRNSSRPVKESTEQFPQTTEGSSPTTASESEQEYEEDEPQYTQVKVQQTTEQIPKRDASLSLSDFWGMFSGGGSGGSKENKTEQESASYEEEVENSASGGSPFNFSAPIDQPLLPMEPEEEEAEYNIPFGEPNNAVTNPPLHKNNNRVHVTGRPTITKIIESDPPTYHKLPAREPSSETNTRLPPIDYSHNGGDVDEESYDESAVVGENPPLKPSVPPVIIGGNDTEPRDWYYTNYHKSEPGGNELLERLLERSKSNQLQDTLVNNKAAPSSISSSLYLALSIFSLLCALV